jgi:carbamoyl-phosphate synthase large subunit
MKTNVVKPAPIVAVTGLHRGDNPQPGAAVVRSLRRHYPDIRVIGLCYDPLESGLYSRGMDHVDAAYLLPFPFKGPDLLLERLTSIHQTAPFDVLIPCLDTELENLMAIYPKLKALGIRAILPSKRSLVNRSKAKLDAFCARHRIPAPRTFLATEPDKLLSFAEEIGYPVYVKGKFYEAHLVYNTIQLAEAFGRISRNWGTPVLVQEALIGEEYDIVGLGDGTGRIIAHCAIKKILKTLGGKGFAGIVMHDPALLQTARTIIKALKWRGPFELEFVKAAGRAHTLIEMNPRFPAWVDFPSQIGCNLPLHLLESLVGEKTTPMVDCRPGQMFLRHCVDLVGELSQLSQLSIEGAYHPQPRFENVE